MRGGAPEEATPSRGTRGTGVRQGGAHSPGPPPGAGLQGAAERGAQRQHLERAARLSAHGAPRARPEGGAPPGAHHLDRRGELITLPSSEVKVIRNVSVCDFCQHNNSCFQGTVETGMRHRTRQPKKEVLTYTRFPLLFMV